MSNYETTYGVASRVILLIRLLTEGPKTKRLLSDRLDVSLRTIDRYLEFLRNEDYVIKKKDRKIFIEAEKQETIKI